MKAFKIVLVMYMMYWLTAIIMGGLLVLTDKTYMYHNNIVFQTIDGMIGLALLVMLAITFVIGIINKIFS